MDETYSKYVFLTTNVYDEMLSRFIDLDENDFGTRITLANSHGAVIFDYFFKCSHCLEEIAFGFFPAELFDKNAYSKLVELIAILKSKIIIAFHADNSINEIVHLCNLYKVEYSKVEVFENSRKNIKNYSLCSLFQNVSVPDGVDSLAIDHPVYRRHYSLFHKFNSLNIALKTYDISENEKLNDAIKLSKLFFAILAFYPTKVDLSDDISLVKKYSRISLIEHLRLPELC